MRSSNHSLRFLFALCVLPFVLSALAQTTATPNLSTFQPFNLSTGSYTNHAGNVISGVVIALDARTATFSNAEETVTLPLSIFPESEQRRLAADFGTPRVPEAILRAIAGAERAIARSRKRAEKGLCTPEESDAFCAKTEAALATYLDNQLESGTITPAERQALGH
ncbi:MAG: hypothetical protein IJT88_00930 [Kiritimatiellae bacterium]|nr:hypothetical protein [Kiritimatiellia bacterium]